MLILLHGLQVMTRHWYTKESLGQGVMGLFTRQAPDKSPMLTLDPEPAEWQG